MADLTMPDVRAKFPQYNDMSDDQLASALHSKFYADMPQDQFYSKIGYTPKSAAPAAPAENPQDMSFGKQLLGNAEIAGSSIANIPHGIGHALVDIYHRITGDYSGNDPAWLSKLHVPTGQAGQELSQGLGDSLTQTIDAAGGGDAATKAAGAVQNFGQEPGTAGNFVRNVAAPITGDVAALAGARGVPGQMARLPGQVGEALSGARSLINGSGFDVPEGPQPTDVGLKPVEDVSGVGKRMAGTSAQPALQLHHQAVGNAISGAEAGVVDPAAKLTPEALAEGRTAPSAVMGRVANATPAGPVEQGTLDAIDNAGGSGVPISGKGSIDNIQSMRDNLKAALAKPDLTGNQKVDWLQALRTKGYKNMASQDPGSQELGQAQLDAAHALEQHIENSLPANGDVSIDQFRAARTALAKNHTVEAALKGNDVDMGALARIYRKNPNLMTEGLGMLGRFAAENPEVTGVPDHLNAPSVGGDLLNINPAEKPLSSTLQAATGWLGRRMLTGNTGKAVQAARDAFAGNPSRFSPIDNTPQPPPGMTASTPTAPPPAPAGGQGGIPLADLLSHGLEQNPPAGLTAGPMGAPAGQGLPFRASPEAVGARPVQGGPRDLTPPSHILGPDGEPVPTGVEPQSVRLGDRLAAPEDSWFKAPGDNAAVMSSQVPTGTMTRTGTKANMRLADELDIPGTRPQVSLSKPAGQAFTPGQRGLFNGGAVENNASGESSASLEAQSRLGQEKATGSQPFMINPEGAPQLLAHTVDAVDAKAPKGHLKVQIDPSTGKPTIMDRGGLTLAAAKGLLNRYLALHANTPLGSEF